MRVWKADWHSISNDVDDKPVYCGEERAKLDGLPVDLHSYPHLWTQALGSELKYWHHQHNQQIRDRVRSLVVLEGLKVESFLLHIKRSGMLPGCLQGELFWSCPIVRTLWGTPKRCWRDYISQKDCEYLGVFLEVLGEAMGGGVGCHSGKTGTHSNHDSGRWMDGTKNPLFLIFQNFSDKNFTPSK